MELILIKQNLKNIIFTNVIEDIKPKRLQDKKVKKELVNYFFNNLHLYRKKKFDNQKYNDLIYSLNIKKNYLIGDGIVRRCYRRN